jgi:para-nitrobenzyl esterase
MMKLFTPGPRTFASPFVDGKIAVDAAAAYAQGNFAHVPLMIGATSGDMGGRTGFMIAGARKVAGTVTDKGVPVYAYRFSYVAESQPASAGAGHASDIPFFFDTTRIKYGAQTSPRDMAMGKAISAYIVNFARTGDPNGAGLPAWPLYDRAGDRIMDFAASGKPIPEKDPWGAEIDAAPAGR